MFNFLKKNKNIEVTHVDKFKYNKSFTTKDFISAIERELMKFNPLSGRTIQVNFPKHIVLQDRLEEVISLYINAGWEVSCIYNAGNEKVKDVNLYLKYA